MYLFHSRGSLWLFIDDLCVRLIFLFAPHSDSSIALVMHLHVIPERSLAGEIFVANFTLERLLARVNPEMIVKMAPVVELSTTFVAFKRPFT